MLVYGDPHRFDDPAALLQRLLQRRDAAAAARPGILRHGHLVALLAEAGQLAQAVLDEQRERLGFDELTPTSECCGELALACAEALENSWNSDFTRGDAPPRSVFDALERLPLPRRARVVEPEGYAFYAVYPESYGAAARVLAGMDVLIVGLRSIGTSLAASVAAAARADAAVTLRPVGPPFERTVVVGPHLRAHLEACARRGACAAVVDEGPGLSGSSFIAAASLLSQCGFAEDQVRFFPAHRAPPGPAASADNRARWSRAVKHTCDFDELFLDEANPRRSIGAWVEDLVGRVRGRPVDVGAGRWRSLHFRTTEDWPAANVQQERRKYLVEGERGTYLLKFAGLGAHGERALARARVLDEARAGPPVPGLRNGFLVQRWLAAATPLRASQVPRRTLLERVADYIAVRMRGLADVDVPGASLEELREMARVNSGEALGPEIARKLDALGCDGLRPRPIQTDNRMHAWEWLVTPDGELVKTDAADHCAAHDLIGCQDAAWDVAGASIELGLDANELASALARRGSPIDPALSRFYEPCYLAFQLGSHSMAARSIESGAPDEAARLRRAADTYARQLASWAR